MHLMSFIMIYLYMIMYFDQVGPGFSLIFRLLPSSPLLPKQLSSHFPVSSVCFIRMINQSVADGFTGTWATSRDYATEENVLLSVSTIDHDESLRAGKVSSVSPLPLPWQSADGLDLGPILQGNHSCNGPGEMTQHLKQSLVCLLLLQKTRLQFLALMLAELHPPVAPRCSKHSSGLRKNLHSHAHTHTHTPRYT